MIKPIIQFSAVIVLTAAVSACGSKVPRPVSELALTDSALQSAEKSGARQYAPIELRIAREKKEAADAAAAKKKYAQARYLSEQARVDAELAQAAAQAEKSRLALGEAQNNIRMIQEEVTRTRASQ